MLQSQSSLALKRANFAYFQTSHKINDARGNNLTFYLFVKKENIESDMESNLDDFSNKRNFLGHPIF